MGFSPGIPSRAARGLLGSEVKSTMDFGAQTIAQQKSTLRTWFARYFDDGMTKEDVENWFDTLGAKKTSGDGALAARLRGDEERPRPSLIPRIADLNHGKPAVVPRHAVDRVAALVRGGQSSRGDAAASTRRS